MSVNLIYGPPGTGKTTYLIEQVVAKELPYTSPDRIGYLAFTQKAAREALNRALAFFPDQNENAFSCKIFFHVRGVRELQELGIVLERLR